MFRNVYRALRPTPWGAAQRWQSSAPVVQQARLVLAQQLRLLNVVQPEHYSTKPKPYNASIGGHLRHTLDHFNALLLADREATVRYDQRRETRGGAVESDPDVAKAAVQTLLECLDRLEQTQELHRPVTVAFMQNIHSFPEYELSTNLERELSFVAHHAVHHLAMVKLIAESQGYEFPDDVGVAPATLEGGGVGAAPPADAPRPLCNPGIRKDKARVTDSLRIESVKANQVSLCRCWRSKRHPFCDGSHLNYNESSGDNVGPIVVKKRRRAQGGGTDV